MLRAGTLPTSLPLYFRTASLLVRREAMAKLCIASLDNHNSPLARGDATASALVAESSKWAPGAGVPPTNSIQPMLFSVSAILKIEE